MKKIAVFTGLNGITNKYGALINLHIYNLLGVNINYQIIQEEPEVLALSGKDKTEADLSLELARRAEPLIAAGADELVIPNNMYGIIHGDRLSETTDTAVIKTTDAIGLGAADFIVDKLLVIGPSIVVKMPELASLLKAEGIEIVLPKEAHQEKIDQSIYPGLKACDAAPSPYLEMAVEIIASSYVGENAVQGVLFVCTEFSKLNIAGFPFPVLDSVWLHTRLLAREVINSMTLEEAKQFDIEPEALVQLKKSPYKIL